MGGNGMFLEPIENHSGTARIRPGRHIAGRDQSRHRFTPFRNNDIFPPARAELISWDKWCLASRMLTFMTCNLMALFLDRKSSVCSHVGQNAMFRVTAWAFHHCYISVMFLRKGKYMLEKSLQ